jgi:hypothetical protein
MLLMRSGPTESVKSHTSPALMILTTGSRRGHIRRYENGLRIWVNASVVNLGTIGKVEKTYALKAPSLEVRESSVQNKVSDLTKDSAASVNVPHRADQASAAWDWPRIRSSSLT